MQAGGPRAGAITVAVGQGHRVLVLFALRADFVHRALEPPEFARLLNDHLYSSSLPSLEAMREAIEGPARSAGLALEPGLVAAILGDAADEPGSLPLLQLALTELWRHQRNGFLTHEDYRRLGGCDSAARRVLLLLTSHQLTGASRERCCFSSSACVILLAPTGVSAF